MLFFQAQRGRLPFVSTNLSPTEAGYVTARHCTAMYYLIKSRSHCILSASMHLAVTSPSQIDDQGGENKENTQRINRLIRSKVRLDIVDQQQSCPRSVVLRYSQWRYTAAQAGYVRGSLLCMTVPSNNIEVITKATFRSCC